MNNIRFAFAAAINARCDYQCPAVQNAIDAVASESRNGRAGLLEQLQRTCTATKDGLGWERTADAEFCDMVMVRWGRAPLKLATGRSRDEWLTLINHVMP